MSVNQKKNITLVNRTKYFNPEKDRTHVTFSSPNTYQSRQMKIEGYETRLYWQYRYCESVGGQTFFYTLTYNDASLPNHYGINCFDYEDLRDLLTGGFRKKLLRKYGTKFKYFIGAELGDGKGERGLHNNPHYHILFFLEPANNERFPYIPISPEDFRHLVRLYWQGFDEEEKRQDFQTAKYGIVKEGDNIGKVYSFCAEEYVAKYVCKDVKLQMKESNIRQFWHFHFKNKLKFDCDFNREFYYDVLFPMYNIPLNSKNTKWLYSNKQFLDMLLPNYSEFHFDEMDDSDYTIASRSICGKYKLWNLYNDYMNSKIEEYINEKINEWRNRYCNKCRISHGVGDYALNFIGDKLNPTIQVPDKKGFKNRPLSMYYYRKLFTDVVTPIVNGIKYSPIRVLNNDGIMYKVARLDSQIEKLSDKASNNLELIRYNSKLFEKMRESDINTEVFYHYDNFFERLNYLYKENNNEIKKMLRRYAEYKLVYENRYFSTKDWRGDTDSVFPCINIVEDYIRFLTPSIYSIDRSDIRLDAFLKDDGKEYLPYAEHPYFLQDIGIFAVLDMCSNFWFIQGDNKNQEEGEERARVRRFHNSRKLKDFYRNLGFC